MIIAICIPSPQMVHADFSLCLATMVHGLGEHQIGFISAKSAIVAEARNMGVDFARDIGADYLLFIDSDMIFPANALRRLLIRRLAVVGATYARRTPPIEPLGRSMLRQPNDAPPGLALMERMPAGFLLIRTDVFPALSRPYFKFACNDDGTITSEDYYFSDCLRQEGIDLWCDVELSREIGHIGQTVFHVDHDFLFAPARTL